MTTQDRHVRIVSLWLHPEQEGAFEAFECEAARIMERHGGRIDTAVRCLPVVTGVQPFEVHVVSFPDRAAAESCALDPETLALQPLRAKIIARTEVIEGRQAGPYR